ncbi:MAG: AAA family ATPase [Actinomycetota bacterium]
MSRLRIVTLAGDPEREAGFARRLSNRHDVELLLRCVDRIELLAALRGGGIDAIVSVGAPAWFDAHSAREAAADGVRLVGVVSNPIEGDLLGPLGAALVPADSSIEEILERCSANLPVIAPEEPRTATSRGRLIAVWGPKGAPGRTTVAIELSAELAAVHEDTLLVDGDSYGGDVLQLLGVVDELPTIVWAARMAAKDELGAARLTMDFRRAGREGPVILPGIPRSDLWADVSESGWSRLLEVARDAFLYTVCDVGFCIEPDASPFAAGSGRNRLALETLQAADHCVAVCRADPVGIKNFLWGYEGLRETVDPDKILVVVNRVSPGEQREVAEMLRRHTHKRPIACVPDRPQLLARAVGEGKAARELDPGSGIAAAMQTTAATVGAQVKPDGLLTRLGGRS